MDRGLLTTRCEPELFVSRLSRFISSVSRKRESWNCNRVQLALVDFHDGRLVEFSKGKKSQLIHGCFASQNGTQAPLLDALRDYAMQDVAPFHFPGHGRGRAAPSPLVEAVGIGMFAHDLPTLPGLDNLFSPESVIAEAQNKASLAFGAESTFFLVNGTTCGIHAAVMATCKPGDVLILPRNCHLSTISAMVFSGALPFYVMPAYDANWGVAHGVSGLSIEEAISKVGASGKRVGAVLIVSPTYYGVCSSIAEIAAVSHDNEVPLIVDEAHGAHFRFHQELPSTALEEGADIAVQSTHKVLGSLTQSSMLHVGQGGRVDRDLLRRCLRMVQSSSPSYLLLSSLDAARAQMTNDDVDENSVNFSSDRISAALHRAALARNRLKEIPNLVVMERENMQGVESSNGLDPLRITVGLWKLGVDGYEADEVLRLEFGVIAELPEIRSITFAITSGTSELDVIRLVEALRALSIRFAMDDNAVEKVVTPLQSYDYLMRTAFGSTLSSGPNRSPRDAFFAKTQKVNAANAVGHISAELLCPYPPGIPVIFPGEMISANSLRYLRNVLECGGTISGASDPSLSTISVCK